MPRRTRLRLEKPSTISPISTAPEVEEPYRLSYRYPCRVLVQVTVHLCRRLPHLRSLPPDPLRRGTCGSGSSAPGWTPRATWVDRWGRCVTGRVCRAVGLWGRGPRTCGPVRSGRPELDVSRKAGKRSCGALFAPKKIIRRNEQLEEMCPRGIQKRKNENENPQTVQPKRPQRTTLSNSRPYMEPFGISYINSVFHGVSMTACALSG